MVKGEADIHSWLDCWLGVAQLWNERDAQEEVLGMVIRTGLYTTMGTMLRQVMAPLNAVDHVRDPAVAVSPPICCVGFLIDHGLPDDRLPKKLLFGHVKGRRPPGCPRSNFKDVAVHDCHMRRIAQPYKDAQKGLLWRDKTCLAPT